MKVINFTMEGTLGLSVIVLLLGYFLIDRIKFLKRFCIPAPVLGGLFVSLLAMFFYKANIYSLVFDQTLKDFFMICFFASIGFGADLGILVDGGRDVVKFLFISLILLVLQNFLGLGLAMVLGENPLLGMATGSIPMVGGHGTSAAFGPELVRSGLPGGSSYAIAAATFGLMAGSFIGGPVAKGLIEKHRIETPYAVRGKGREIDGFNYKESGEELKSEDLFIAFLQIAVSLGIGSFITGGLNKILSGSRINFPVYIGAMMVATIMRNIIDDRSRFSIREREIDALGNIFLSFFLAQALMGLRLWELTELALPMIIILIFQTALMFFWAKFVTFNIMGRDYDAVVLAAGNCGFGMGATPNAMANMEAVTASYGPSPKAFFILPIIGSLFIDFINIGVIFLFLNFL